jgi:hypothetical protein
MPKFQVEIKATTYRTFEIDAESSDEAVEKAFDDLMNDHEINSEWKEAAELESVNMIINDRESLIDKYAQQSVDGMDLGTLMGFAKDTIETRLNGLSDKEILEEIQEYSPELLEY